MNKKGFTIIEILVVLLIMGIFVAMTAFGIQNARESSRDTKREADVKQIQTGLSRFFADCFSYPTANEFSSAQTNGTLTGIATKAPGCYSTNTYIEEFPLDPESPSVNYSYTLVDNSNYVLCASLKEAPSQAQDTTGCGSCGARACNIKVTN